MFRNTGLSLVIALLTTGSVCAQAVQLPEFRYFTVNTTVSVPDRGGVYLGGVNRASSGSVSRGVPLLSDIPGAGRLFRDAASGSSASAAGVSVQATIIDHAELDRAVLAAAAARRARLGDTRSLAEIASEVEANRKADFLARNVARSEPAGPMMMEVEEQSESLDQIRRRTELAQRQRDAQSVAYFEQGRAAEEAGKFGAARVFYKMAVRRADGPFQAEISARLAALSDERSASVASSAR